MASCSRTVAEYIDKLLWFLCDNHSLTCFL